MPGTLPMADPPRVPAWKKLGLQLKFANQDATPPSTDRPKKRRKRNDAQPEPDEDPSLVPTLDQKSSQEVTETVTPKSKKLKKSKSVTFTPETKKEDGDSIKQLFGAWVQSQKEEALTSEGWGDSDNAGIAEPQAEAQPTKKKKAKARKSKAQAATALESSSETVHPAIGYLHQYRLDRDHWKFNKARQSYILKHIFDLDRIPKTCTVALGEYIAGLQGDAARSRINKEAEEIINNDIEWSASQVDETEEEGKKKNIFKSAVKEFMSRMQEPKWYVKPDVESATPLENEEAKRLLKRKRAHVLLEVLGPGTTTRPELSEDIKEQTLSQTSSTDVTGVPKTRRMRKRRTTDISDDDTSSDSESESSSDDSSASDDTTSSSDSDSDSNSNSDSESDSSEESDSSSDSD